MMATLLAPSITIPTRINNNGGGTLIDNIFTNTVSPNISSGNLKVSISDHLPSFLIVPIEEKQHKPQSKIQYKRDTRNFSKDDFILDYLNIDWDSELELERNDVNFSTEKLFSKMTDIIDKHMPVRKLTAKERKQTLKPWITPAILAKITTKNKLYKKLTKTKSIETQFQFNKIKNEITSLTRKSKERYYKNYFEKHNKNLRKIWSGIKEIINVKQKSSSLPTCLANKDRTVTDPKEIADYFNCYFSNIAENTLKSRKFEGTHSYKEYLKNPLPNSHIFFSCEPSEVECLISSLEISKASGPYSIPVNVLHMLKRDISIPLSKIFNLSMKTGTHPDCLKLAMVIPIHKKESKLEVSNYRISLLSNINKLLEKIVHERTYSFLEKFGCLYKHQYGFRKSHSTNHALIEITEKIRKALDSGKFACGIFVYLQKAFDTVNHEILLKKLEHYGIRGTSNSWFKSYLNNRKQLVSLNGVDSEMQIMKHGVPQGSVLGPLLFLVYINDLHNAILYSQSFHFADDTNLLNINDSPKKVQKQLNIDLKLLNNWLLANKISLNSKKTEMIIFQKPGFKLNWDWNVRLNGYKLHLSDQIKYLGIFLDRFLNCHYQSNLLMQKLARAIGMLSKVRYYVQDIELKNIYHAIFESHIRYGCMIWFQSNSEFIKDKIQKLQKKALRMMSFSELHESSSPLFKKWKILKIEDIVEIQNCVFVHSFLKGKLPKSFENFFLRCSDVHTNPTRFSNAESL